ncbi:DUF5686 and carboxypeptidase-like regulatory domain-containing protein [Luteibaculum oceani]|uniref:DUF5686 and carboxypeptidase-like regulatory domain-containing protein n=1 Tax=Luteibaculum oceani TaxID=1294296 RepID=UPI0014768D92|nr:DUF5686 and carboxypeptidase-like regulatory domain-containing protein [Luteibaculum oceani]
MVLAQTNISGKVIDVETKTPLAFVNIVVNEENSLGTNSDLHGNFTIQTQKEVVSLSFSFVGYEKLFFQVDSSQNQNLLIALKPKITRLAEVEILPGLNPAHRIIDNCVANRNVNDPSKYEAYRCKIHFKMHFDVWIDDVEEMQFKDSSLEGGYAFLTETISDRIYQKPDQIKETIIANRVSGFKNPLFASLVTELQPFSFYKPQISVFEDNFLNPISSGSTKSYLFTLQDTLYTTVDSTFVISFQPRSGKNFTALKGLLYINSKDWAIENIIAEPQEKGIIHFKLQQQYNTVEGKWFPKALNFESTISMQQDTVALFGKAFSIIDSVSFPEKIKKRNFGLLEKELLPDAGQRDDSFWAENRFMELNEKDSATYRVIDKIGEAANFDKLQNVFSFISEGRINFGYWALGLNHLYRFNEYEGSRLGLELYTGKKVSDRFILGGYFAYGFRDKASKYGLSSQVVLNRRYQSKFNFSYSSDLRESGKFFSNPFNRPIQNFRDFLAFDFTRFTGWSASFSSRLNRSFTAFLSYNQYQWNRASIVPSNLSLENINQPDIKNSIDYVQAGIRFAAHEKLVEVFGHTNSYGSKYPVLSVWFTSNGYTGKTPSLFSRTDLELSDAFGIKKLGTTQWRIRASYIHSLPTNLDPGFIITGLGANSNFGLQSPGHFQTMQPYEFAGTEFAGIFIKHEFGSLLFKTTAWKPEISLAQNSGFTGIFSSSSVNYPSFDKGYHESGIIVDNIVRFKYMDLFYLELGVGGYYRYGSYANSNLSDNLAFTLSLIAKTR